MTWHLQRDGRELVVAEDPAVRRRTVLEVDGAAVADATTDYWGSSVLEHADLRVKVEWGPRNRLHRVRLLREGDDDEGLDFVPPPGSAAARREALRRDHPVRFTLQSVAGAGVGVLLGLLGINALLGSLLPRIDWSWLPDLPDLPDAPAWLRYLDPFHWLAKIPWPDVSLPDLPDLVPDWLADSSTYWLPLVIAAVVALAEIDRRRKQDAERRGRAPDGPDGPDEPDEPEADEPEDPPR